MKLKTFFKLLVLLVFVFVLSMYHIFKKCDTYTKECNYKYSFGNTVPIFE